MTSRLRKVFFWSAVCVLIVGVSIMTREGAARRAAAIRNRAYIAQLERYSAEFKPGLKRTEVERSLQSQGIPLQKMCCFHEKSAYADLVNVGQEPAPWYCDANLVYVVLEFHSDAKPRFEYDDSDTLTEVHLETRPDRCL